MSSSITHWRLYLSCPIGDDGSSYVEISEQEAKGLQAALKDPAAKSRPVVTGRELNFATYRTLYVVLSNIVALEPRED
jgi:hypothetical protein